MQRQHQRARSTAAQAHLVRLNKFLADAGIASRRHAEELILQGRVTVDGATCTELAVQVDPLRQKVRVDGEPVRPERKVYYLINKPKGYVSTNAIQPGQPRVVDLLPRVLQRVYTVGRLDKFSEGLMLVTNDGDLANRLAHPRYGVEKTYVVQAAGRMTRAELEQLKQGVWLDVGRVRPKGLKVRSARDKCTVLEIVLTEGRNREIRRMLARLGHKVLNLRRVAFAGIRLGKLPIGEVRRLRSDEINRLRALVHGRRASMSPKRHSTKS